VLVLDPQGRVRDANHAAEALAGMPPALGTELAAWPRLGAPLAQWLQATPESPPPLLALGDPPRVFEVGVREIAPQGSLLGRLVQLRDVTEHHRLQLHLERRLHERDSQLRQVAALQQDLREQALRDPLTGLLNRRALAERFQQGLATPFALAIVDVDHFKLINDETGHAAGDRVLKALAQRLKAGLRRGDEVFRVGGEEFVVLLPGAELAGAMRRLDALRQQVAAQPLDGAPAAVTVSAGVAASGAQGQDLDTLFAAADAALYRAKTGGRNRVEAAVAGG
jgi:diguanylate cyclase (GGDEF)-like protein